jgi:16S rRNA (guanine(966)-N(2))-methyltransferase RsmD
VRVIAGTAKGRKLEAVPGDTTRPITDRAKEALFSILHGDVAGARVLDLFAGTGSVGIEALSRGAAFCEFVERDAKAAATIRRNLEHTGLAGRATVSASDVFIALKREPRAPFDIVYVAPPQYRGLWSATLRTLDASGGGWLERGALVVAQIHPKEFEELELASLRLVDKRRYGSVLLVFYEVD